MFPTLTKSETSHWIDDMFNINLSMPNIMIDFGAILAVLGIAWLILSYIRLPRIHRWMQKQVSHHRIHMFGWLCAVTGAVVIIMGCAITMTPSLSFGM